MNLCTLKDDILKIVPSDEPSVIQQYLEDYLILLRDKIDQYTTELIAQSALCPSTLPRLEIIDSKLQEFVRLHHLDLSRTIDSQIGKLNANINIKKFAKQLAIFHLTTKQVLILIEILYISVSRSKFYLE